MLNEFERSLMADANVLLTKNEIINKIIKLFAHLSETYVRLGNNRLHEQYTSIPPKISRGEKYQGLPYVVLDYPRVFSQSHVAAIRTLFWWGNYFSITLHLQGIPLQQHAPIIGTAIEARQFDGWLMQVDGDAWQHAIEHPYKAVRTGGDYTLSQMPFVKLAKKIPLPEWDNIDQMMMTEFEKLSEMLSTNPVK